VVNVITLTHVSLGPAAKLELSPIVVDAEAEMLNEVTRIAAVITFATELTRETKLEKILFRFDIKWHILLFSVLIYFLLSRATNYPYLNRL
jgi:hypothetical protein